MKTKIELPSPRHQWKLRSKNVDICMRCGDIRSQAADIHGSTWCYATPEWLEINKGDHPLYGRPPIEGGLE